VPRGAERLDAKVADLDDFAVPDGLRARNVLGRIRDDSRPEAALELLVVGDVIGVRVRREEVRDLHL
jgi:hypothetical protein